MNHLLRLTRRLMLALCLIILFIGLAWQGLSLFAADGRALAPLVGQYYIGETWMATPTPAPTPPLPALPASLPSPQPTVAPPAPPVAATVPMTQSPAASEPTPTAPLPTAEPYVVEVARSHGIDPANAYIVVNQNTQRMTIVQAGHVARILPISSGDPDHGWYTPAWSGVVGEFWGTFTANGVTADDAWYLFQAGGSILIHSLPYTLAPDGSKLYQGQDDLGIFPASRGCIRIAPEDARWLTEWGPYGVPIVILPWNGGTGRAG